MNLGTKNESYATLYVQIMIIRETSKSFYSPSTILERFLLSRTVQKHLIAKQNPINILHCPTASSGPGPPLYRGLTITFTNHTL